MVAMLDTRDSHSERIHFVHENRARARARSYGRAGRKERSRGTDTRENKKYCANLTDRLWKEWKEGKKILGTEKKCSTHLSNDTETTRTRRHPTTHPYSREHISCVQHCNVNDTHDLGTCFLHTFYIFLYLAYFPIHNKYRKTRNMKTDKVTRTKHNIESAKR